MKTTTQRLGAAATFCALGLIPNGCKPKATTSAVSLVDDGGGRKPADFPELSLITLTSEEIKGRKTWNI